MNIVDSSGWLAYFADEINAKHFMAPLSNPTKLIVPAITIYEVFKVILRESSENEALQAVVAMQKGEVITTVYGTGKVTMTMVKNEDEAKKALENLRSTINEAIAKGVAPAPREKVRIEPMELYKYLPQTNCGKCGEQSCYTFAIKLMGGEVTLDKCSPLKESSYITNFEHLQVLSAYI